MSMIQTWHYFDPASVMNSSNVSPTLLILVADPFSVKSNPVLFFFFHPPPSAALTGNIQ